MADRSKAEKLALARRKLKEYQKKEKNTSVPGITAKIRSVTKHDTDDVEKQTTEDSFVLDTGPIHKQPEGQNSGEGSNCPSPEIKNNEVQYNINRNEVNGNCETVAASQTVQYPSVQYASPISSFPQTLPSVADMFVSSQHANNEAETFFNSIMPSHSFDEKSNKYAFFPVQSSNFIAQDNVYQKPKAVNGTTVLTSESATLPSEPPETFFSTQPSAQSGETLTYLKGDISSEAPTDLTKCHLPSVPELQCIESKVCLTNSIEGVMPCQQHESLSHGIVSENFSKETSGKDFLPQPLSQLSLVEQDINPTTIQEDKHISNDGSNQLVVERDTGSEETVAKPMPLSSTESLRQMSLQINDLISETYKDNADSKRNCVSELEHRNQELASMLTNEQQKNEQLQLQLKEYQSRMSQLESDVSKVRAESEALVTREVGPLQEQLQLHAQTVGILVGEKTELQSALSKSQQLAKQKAAEAEELQGRLKASRHKVTGLEKQVSELNMTYQQLHNAFQEVSSEVGKKDLEWKLVKRQLEETEEEKSEIQQRLNSRTSEISALQQELQERQSQLSLTQLRIQQLSMSGNSELDSQVEALNQQKISLEHQVAELQQTVRSVTAERDQASQQYQQYVQQLNAQLQNLVLKLESATAENENSLSREQSLIHHVSELEKQLQLQQQQQQQQNLPIKEASSQDLGKIQELHEKMSALEEERKQLHDMNDTQQQQIEELAMELKERLRRIEDLESMIEGMREDQPNKERLLAAIESDKVAAARAVAQNQKLKDQLEELQQGFVTMSNTKLDLTEKLEHEQYVNKEKQEQFLAMETELRNIKVQLQEKKIALHQLENKLADAEKQNEIRMKQDKQCQTLNQELADAEDASEQLKVQKLELSSIVEQQKSQQGCDSSEAYNQKDEVIASLSASIQQLEAERDSLLSHLQQAKQSNNSDTMQPTVHINPHTEPREMKEAMQKLEEKLKRTMEEIAELSDEKQRLEHLVLQLQGETETIGEYIALYQVQRSILQQRAKENDEQLARVSKDREEMKRKLQELSELVRKLVPEKENSLDQCDACENKHIPDTAEQITVATDNETTTVNGDHNIKAEKSGGALLEENSTNKAVTAEKIIALLSEIGSSNLVDPQTIESFHPCPWCSGRLLTV